jgi:hypothetical protein
MEKDGKQAKDNGSALSAGAILKVVYALVGAIVFLVAAYHGLNSYLEARIESKINNADFLKKLARSVRPSIVFDERGSIVADMGAVPFVNNISVSKTPKDGFKIVVSPVDYLGVEPVLEALDGNYTIRVERGQKFDWVFHLSGIQTLVLESSPKRDSQRFRLEIIRQ